MTMGFDALVLGMPIEVRVLASEIFQSATMVILNIPIKPEPEPEMESPPRPPFCS